MSVSAHKTTRLYVLVCEETYWLTTIATNRRKCWLNAKPFCYSEDWKAELKDAGYRCVPVVMIETLLRPVDACAAVAVYEEGLKL